MMALVRTSVLESEGMSAACFWGDKLYLCTGLFEIQRRNCKLLDFWHWGIE